MKWISSISATTLILLLLSGISHVTLAKEEVGLTAAKLQDVVKDKVCSFMKQSQKDQFLVLSDFVKRHDAAELKENFCADASQRMAIQKFLWDSDVKSCLTKEMSATMFMAQEAMGTKDGCYAEIDEEVALIKGGGRSLRGVVDRELWIWIVVRIIIIIIILLWPKEAN